MIETDEECSYKFSARDAQGSVHSYTTLIRGNENTPVDVESEFDRLVIENRNRSSGKPSGTRTESPNNRLKDLQRWMIEDDNSFAPTWLGSDFRDAWRKPNWPASAALSSRLTLLDVRPILSEFNPPQELLATRKGVLQTLRTFDGGSTSCVEDVRLGELMRDATFCGLVETYVRQFADWLVQDYERAAWMDTIAVSFPDDSGLALNPYPVALILSPLHPLRLGWQCNAQKMLTDALDASMPCPAASVLDPSTFPDCMELPCRSASGQISHRKYISVRSTSDYWTVLWAQDEMSKCSSDVARATFGADLGLRVEGLSPGFTVSQVTRSLNEVTSIFPARSTLKVAILSDTKEASPINDGIAEWCEDSLGPVEDLWFNAGPKKLEVIDTRGPSEQPDEAYLASTCRRTGDSLNWYTATIDDPIKQCDLAVIAHLSTSPPEFQTHEMRSILDPHAVYRQRIRKLVGSLENRFIAESRIGKFDMTSADVGLPSALLECVCHLESSCTPSFDSHVTAPRLTTLDRALSIAEYCALTAANVDPACFLGNAGPTYLWDYELPSYSRRAGHNEGYYLLAGASPRMARAVSNASAVLAGNRARLENSAISQLLAESSRRGVPTLKRLTSGGSASLGEIGTLIALRVIQPELCDDLLGPSLFSVLSKDNLINLLVPVDPFIEHIRTLRTALGTPSSERPDLLAFSVSHQNGIPDGIRITPIEVKARYGALAHGQRKLALAQASDFSDFLVALKNRASQSTLWRVAWVHF